MNADMVTYLILGLIFGAVVLGVLAIAPMFEKKVNLAQRLSSAPSANTPVNSNGIPTLRSDSNSTLWGKLIHTIESHGLSLDDDKAPILKERLSLAGYNQPYAVRAFVLIRTSLTLLLPIISYAVITLGGASLSATKLYMALVGSAAAGLYLPNMFVSNRAEARMKEILDGFPDALDLMLVCVEAGLGIDACFARVGQEIVNLHPRLAELFATVSLELRAGRPRAEALKNMARKSGVPEIQSFATLVVQSDKLGASIGTALKIYAGEMRESRRMRAEEKAHRLPVILSIPMVLFLLPTMIGVLALPASISLRDTMFND
ncbi:type II secretion system F family protein [Sandaracinobacteroides hominis]|uniref:type II secretion system F family protein n=1 Tax=Sandaracinobacteroides hominis TaxID=2780086 RepID=UPI0018F658BA|nr:type II secretion system F family protein [Sandaracinobacteroides hominis]